MYPSIRIGLAASGLKRGAVVNRFSLLQSLITGQVLNQLGLKLKSNDELKLGTDYFGSCASVSQNGFSKASCGRRINAAG